MNYLVVDLMSDYKALMDYKDIRDLLIEQLVNDLRENMTEIELKDTNIKTLGVLERLAREKDTSLGFIEKQLEDYSFKIIDLQQLHRDLYDLHDFLAIDTELDKTLDIICKIMNEGVDKNGN